MPQPTHSDWHIRPGQPADAGPLAALATQVFLHTYATQGVSAVIAAHVLSEFTVAKFQAVLARETSTVLVAEQHAHLLGYANIEFGVTCPARSASTVELATLYVQAHFVGQGVGSALLARAQTLAWQRTQQPLWLTVNAQNARAIGYYAARGFSKIGIAQFVLGDESHENHVLVDGRQPGTAPEER